MALIECNECGAQVSGKASKCPQCGNPLKPNNLERAKTFFKSKLFIGIICSLIGLAGIYMGFMVELPVYSIEGDVYYHGFMDDVANAYVVVGEDTFWHLLYIIIGLIFSCIAMKVFFPKLKKVYFIAFIAAATTFTGLNIIEEKNETENWLKYRQAKQIAYMNSPDYEIKKLAYEKAEAGKNFIIQEGKGCSNAQLTDTDLTDYCNALKKSAIDIYHTHIDELNAKEYDVTYTNRYGNQETSQAIVFFKGEEPVTFLNKYILAGATDKSVLRTIMPYFK